jgi:glucokinase
MATSAVIAIDFGGTNLRAALVTADGAVLHRVSAPTRAEEGVQPVIDRIEGLARQVIEAAGAGPDIPLGVVAPGPIDPEEGIIYFGPNLPGWRNVPLRAILAERLGRRIVIGNDGNGAALGEAMFGAARGCRHLIHLMIGTGLGSGILAHGQLIEGHRGLGAEVGHLPVDPHGPRCHCGGVGCLEAYVSGWALARDGAALAHSGRSEAIRRAAAGGPVTAEIVTEAARAGDQAARSVFESAGRALAVGLGGLVNVFNPEMIVIGGGVAKAGDLLLEPLRRWLPYYAITSIAEAVRILPSALGEDAGIYGAAARAFLVAGGSAGSTVRLG